MEFRKALKGHHKEVAEIMLAASLAEIPLEQGDFRVIDGVLTLDGMDAREWLYAMTDYT